MELRDYSQIELWGGFECSIVRIGETARDQLAETGHLGRSCDFESVAALGLKTVRYPLLWESVSPERPDAFDWRGHDERFQKIRELGMTPVVGLVHHGSGPSYTDLLDPHFPRLLAAYARKVAERLPWVENFTPINEPLTTARFSGLYGHWWPHKSDDASFLRALVHQCAAVLLSMEAIREVTPQAKLVQTEDLGKTFSTPLLDDQAAYENQRRWLSLDLLCGRIDKRHPWWRIFRERGVTEAELSLFLDRPCAPDLVGVNHYLTSERYLDERVEIYPPHLHGGNGRRRYADAEAVRIGALDGDTGPAARLKEVWDRYGLPIAITEAHHGCSRDEQLRWLMDVYRAATTLKREGVDIRAVTIWSLFGAFDWNSLLVRKAGHYEPGAFDVRSAKPRPTALAKAAASLAAAGDYDHPILDAPGWWKRDNRHYARAPRSAPRRSEGRRLLAVTGATGTLGRAISRICESRGLEHVLLSRADMDIAEEASVKRKLEKVRPWAVINAAGYVDVARAHRESDRCMRENARGPETLARATSALGVPFVTFSSDLVFDGLLGRAYREPDATSPLCVYGLSKAEAERRVAAAHRDALIIRTSAFFGPWDQFNFAFATLARLRAGKAVHASAHMSVTPTYVPDLVHIALDLLIDGETGVWHLANRGCCNWYDFALRLADEARLPKALVLPKSGMRRDTSLDSARGALMPSLDNAVSRFFEDERRLSA
ncbi:family 1 glycosylhydrolase [Methylocystis parvus]|uniref:dTDP-4-dehydrorhamnose reductase n=1 Tax=Methylocystis parvus TaxID=134 RepID=A0A6B8M7C8_9HYPH|nr:family 1 glycosylhydrolase [Methylocystis parvus]QGM97233.1 sugar nucleotide-binding protein [Methylocystis parvus]WBJ98858.1 sugar nucleotide-binding protein [Methylocystis parvus OBBP]